MSIKNILVNFLREEDGLTMVEYAIAGGVIAAGLVLIFTNLGTKVHDKMCTIVTAMGGSCTA